MLQMMVIENPILIYYTMTLTLDIAQKQLSIYLSCVSFQQF